MLNSNEDKKFQSLVDSIRRMMSGENINEILTEKRPQHPKIGYSKIMKGLRDSQGPFVVVAVRRGKVVSQTKPIKLVKLLPIEVNDMFDAHPLATIGIESKDGKMLNTFNESVELDEVRNLYENTDMWALAELIKHLHTLMDWENAFGVDRPIWNPDTGEYWPVPRLSPAEERAASEKALRSVAGEDSVFESNQHPITDKQLTEAMMVLNETKGGGDGEYYKYLVAWTIGSWLMPQLPLILAMAIAKGKDLNTDKPTVYPLGSGRPENPYSGTPFPNKM